MNAAPPEFKRLLHGPSSSSVLAPHRLPRLQAQAGQGQVQDAMGRRGIHPGTDWDLSPFTFRLDAVED